MADKRRLQADVERTVKKVIEGRQIFQDTLTKFEQAVTQTQREKFEADLKREIKKLQRFRDQIKNWLACNDIKDKTVLADARREIEMDMERFKVIERETKTKAYSKEGLGLETKKDPLQKEKEEWEEWFKHIISELNICVEKIEFDIEKSTNQTGGKKKRADRGKVAAVDAKRDTLELVRTHVNWCEKCMRSLDNDNLDLETLKMHKDKIEEFCSQPCEAEEFDFSLYEELIIDHDKLESEQILVSGRAQSQSDDEALLPLTPASAQNTALSEAVPEVISSIKEPSELVGTLSNGESSSMNLPSINTNMRIKLDVGNEEKPLAHSSTIKVSTTSAAANKSTSIMANNEFPITLSTPFSAVAAGHGGSLENSQSATGHGRNVHSSTATSPAASVSVSIASSTSAFQPLSSYGASGNGPTPLFPHMSSSSVVSLSTDKPATATHRVVSTSLASSNMNSIPLPIVSSITATQHFAFNAAAAAASSSADAGTSASVSRGVVETVKRPPPPSNGNSNLTVGGDLSQLLQKNLSLHPSTQPHLASPLMADLSIPQHQPQVLEKQQQYTLANAMVQPTPGLHTSRQEPVQSLLSDQMFMRQSTLLGSSNSTPSQQQSISSPFANSFDDLIPSSSRTSGLTTPGSGANPGNTNAAATSKKMSSLSLLSGSDFFSASSGISGVGMEGTNPSVMPLLKPAQQQPRPPTMGMSTSFSLTPEVALAPFRSKTLTSEQLYAADQVLDMGFRRSTRPEDSNRARMTLLKLPPSYETHYPKEPVDGAHTEEYYSALDASTLFFIFYYFEGSRAQYLASKALKKKSWRFHKKHLLWFQRLEEPKSIDEEYESGAYIYWDLESKTQKKKEDFTFEYRFLEDSELS